MKLSITARNLLDAVQAAQQAVAARTTSPILTNCKLAAVDGVLTVTATDLEVSVVRTVAGVSVQRSGEAVASPKKLAEIARSFGDAADLTLSVGEKGLLVSSGRDKFTLPSLDANEFPSVGDADGDAVTLAAGELKRALRVVYAANRRDNVQRFAVHGVYLWYGGGVLTAVGTDTKRLAVQRVPAVGEGEWKALVPLKAVSLVERNLDDDGGPVTLLFGKNTVTVKADRTHLWTRQVEGRFPPFEQFIPKGGVRFEVDAAALCGKVRQAAVTSDAEGKRVDMAFTAGSLVMTAQGPESGASEVTAEVPYEGDDLTIGIDPDYLTDALRQFEGAVTVRLNGVGKPLVLEAGESLAMVMPMGDSE